MKKLKFKFIKLLATLLRCDELINWEEYSEVIPSKTYKGRMPSGLLSFELNKDMFVKQPKSYFKDKFLELGFGVNPNQYNHYEEIK